MRARVEIWPRWRRDCSSKYQPLYSRHSNNSNSSNNNNNNSHNHNNSDDNYDDDDDGGGSGGGGDDEDDDNNNNNNNNNNNYSGPNATGRILTMSGSIPVRVSSPTLWAELFFIKSFLLNPYPVIPPYHIKTPHPGFRSTKQHKFVNLK